jgi:polar amino acid transport system substrate-binding protein
MDVFPVHANCRLPRIPFFARFDRLGGRLCALLAVLLGLVAPACAVDIVRLRFELEANPPRVALAGTEIDWSKPGLSLELLKRVSKRLGIDFVYQRTPWKRSLLALENGDADGVFHASFVPERLETLVYPMNDGKPDVARSMFTQSYALYVTRQSAVRWDGKSLQGVDGPVGVSIGYSIGGELQKRGVTVTEVRSVDAGLGMVAADRLAAYAGLEAMTDAALSAHSAAKSTNSTNSTNSTIIKISPPLQTKPYYLVFSKSFYARQPQLAERIWTTLREVRDSAEFQSLQAQY